MTFDLVSCKVVVGDPGCCPGVVPSPAEEAPMEDMSSAPPPEMVGTCRLLPTVPIPSIVRALKEIKFGFLKR